MFENVVCNNIEFLLQLYIKIWKKGESFIHSGTQVVTRFRLSLHNE